MSAQEEPTKTLHQVRVVTEQEVHYSIAEEYTPESLEDLYRVLNKVTKGSPEDGASFSFLAEEGGGRTFIPARRIRYITVVEVDPPE